MDFTKFSEENFDLKQWINGAFVAQKDTNQNLDQFVSTLITKLQVFIQEINNSIDDTSQQTVQNFPRILREIEVLKQEAFMLKEQMKNVREDLLKVEKNTVNESMKLLLDLDIMRTNIISVQTGLQEADNWSSLTSESDAILESKDINKISDHIESMQTSLRLLEDDSNEYVSRCALLEDFKNKFETLISPEIIASFNAKSIEETKNFVKIFGQINRLDDLKKYYYQCEKVKMLEKSSKLMSELKSSLDELNSNQAKSNTQVTFTINEDTNTTGELIKNVHQNWLDYSIEIWHSETQWCKQIFNDSHAIVINLLTKCFEEFNKSFLKCFENFASHNFEHCLDYLEQLKKETDRFTLVIQSGSESSSSFKTSQFNDLLFKLMKEVYLPFKVYSIKYKHILVKYLQFQLESNVKMNHVDTVECVQLLSDSVTKVFNLIETEIDRCISLTNGCGFAILIDALKEFLKNYIEEFKRNVINLKERNLDTKKVVSSANSSPASASTPAFHISNSAHNLQHHHQQHHIKVEDGAEDWNTFRHFVKIIQIVGDLIIKYENLEDLIDKKVKSIFLFKPSVQSSSNTSLPSSNLLLNSTRINNDYNEQFDLFSINNLKEYLLDDSNRIKLNRFIAIIESGDDYSMMKDLLKPLYLLSENVHKYAFEIVFAPIKFLLKNISKSNVWSKKDIGRQQHESVPLFAFAPQEYITKIGQYLLTLPQNFEPFTMQDNANLIVALHKGKLPYLDVKDLSDDITACWLDSIANATAITFSDEILNIQQSISVNSQRQLIIDIEFICSVFEDVGLKEYTNLLNILELLKVNNEEFDEATKNKPVRIVSSVRKMRNMI